MSSLKSGCGKSAPHSGQHCSLICIGVIGATARSAWLICSDVCASYPVCRFLIRVSPALPRWLRGVVPSSLSAAIGALWRSPAAAPLGSAAATLFFGASALPPAGSGPVKGAQRRRMPSTLDRGWGPAGTNVRAKTLRRAAAQACQVLVSVGSGTSIVYLYRTARDCVPMRAQKKPESDIPATQAAHKSDKIGAILQDTAGEPLLGAILCLDHS
jgi:hypothetical protein